MNKECIKESDVLLLEKIKELPKGQRIIIEVDFGDEVNLWPGIVASVDEECLRIANEISDSGVHSMTTFYFDDAISPTQFSDGNRVFCFFLGGSFPAPNIYSYGYPHCPHPNLI